jgi:hypothetical protein
MDSPVVNKQKKPSKVDILGTGGSGIACLILGVGSMIISLNTLKDLEKFWDIVLFVGILLLGMLLIGIGIIMTIDVCIKWHKYQMKNGLFNYNLQFEDIKHLIPQCLPVMLPEIEKYMNGGRIEEVVGRRDNVNDMTDVPT